MCVGVIPDFDIWARLNDFSVCAFLSDGVRFFGGEIDELLGGMG